MLERSPSGVALPLGVLDRYLISSCGPRAVWMPAQRNLHRQNRLGPLLRHDFCCVVHHILVKILGAFGKVSANDRPQSAAMDVGRMELDAVPIPGHSMRGSRLAPRARDMRVVLSTPLVLDRLNRGRRPYKFLLCPLVDTVVGYPKGIDRNQFTLIAPFTKDKDAWLDLACVNACDGKQFSLALQQDLDGSKVVRRRLATCFGSTLSHPESKSLAPDGMPCEQRSVGLLLRASVTAGHHHFVGKETDRRWEYGEDLSLRRFKVMEYRPAGGMVVPDRALRSRIASSGLSVLMRPPD